MVVRQSSQQFRVYITQLLNIKGVLTAVTVQTACYCTIMLHTAPYDSVTLAKTDF